ncbi:hypothetical protein Btru_055511 [Bulinus truncatus]|nr:hypothetical protein Btru_055511 [Bulinus truncatus]
MCIIRYPQVHSTVVNNVISQSNVTTADSISTGNDSTQYTYQNIHTVQDFIGLLRQEDGRPLVMSELFSEYDNTTGKFVVAEGGGRVAEPDDCSPRMTTVRLNFTHTDPKVVYFPQCTKIERCGGCCSSPNLECIPSYTERVSMRVFKAEVSSTEEGLVYKGFAPVIVERHVMCRIQCSLSAEKCGPSKTFVRHQCVCKCRDVQRCQPPRVWDPDLCSCTCAVQTECCPNGQPCGLAFNRDTCQCSPDTGVVRISASNTYTEGNNNQIVNVSSSGATTVAANSNDPCANWSCPVGSSPMAIPSTSQCFCYQSMNNLIEGQQPSLNRNTEAPSPETISNRNTEAPSPETTSTTTTTTTAPTTISDPCALIHCPVGMTKNLNATTNQCTCRIQIRLRRPRRSPFTP